jgi:hypothetical protein
MRVQLTLSGGHGEHTPTLGRLVLDCLVPSECECVGGVASLVRWTYRLCSLYETPQRSKYKKREKHSQRQKEEQLPVATFRKWTGIKVFIDARIESIRPTHELPWVDMMSSAVVPFLPSSSSMLRYSERYFSMLGYAKKGVPPSSIFRGHATALSGDSIRRSVITSIENTALPSSQLRGGKRE